MHVRDIGWARFLGLLTLFPVAFKKIESSARVGEVPEVSKKL